MNFALIDWLDDDDPDADQREAVNKQKWVRPPISGNRLSTDELRQVDDETWLDPAREAVWKIKVIVDRDANKKITWRRIKSPSGAPILHEIVRPMGKGLKEPDGNEAIFIISWSDRPEVGKVEIGGKALHEGSCWRDHWPGLGISRRGDINFYERIVHLQAGPFKVPNRAWPRHTGFVEKPVDGWRYTLPDGRQVSLAGVTEKGRVAGYSFPRGSDWRGYNPASSVPAGDDISGLAGELIEIDNKGRLLALIALAVRGLVSSISPVRTCALLMGEKRSGKTSSANLARGVVGPCGPGEPNGGAADASFSDTVTSIELSLAALRDAPILVDDARRRPSGSLHETADITLKLERLITSAAQGEPMRKRSNSSLASPIGVTVEGALMLTAENSLVGRLDESRLLRAVLLNYDRGQLDHETLRSEWRRLQSTISSAGAAVVRAVLRALSDQPSHELADAIDKADEVFAAWIRKGLSALAFEPEFIASLADRYSRLMTGMLLVDRACGSRDYQACNALAPHIGLLICDQLDFIAHGGGAGGVDREFMLGAIRWAFSHGAYLLGPDGRPATEMAPPPGNILARGYGWRDGQLTLTGSRLIGRYANRGGEYLIADVLFDYARDYARSIGREPPLTSQTFPAAVVAVRLAQARAGYNAPRVRIGGARYYALHLIGVGTDRDGTDGTRSENESDINALTLSRLPDLGGILRGIDGTGFYEQNQHVAENVPSVPSLSVPAPYRRNTPSPKRAGEPAGVENASNINDAPPLDKPQSEGANREADLQGDDGPLGPGLLLIPPRLAAAIHNPQGPCCPVRRPQMAQDGRSPPPAHIERPRPRTAAGKAPTAASAQRRPAARQASPPPPDFAPAIATIGARAAFRVDRLGEVSPVEGPPPGATINALLDWCEANRIEQISLMPDWCEATGLPLQWLAEDGEIEDTLTRRGLKHPWPTPSEGGRWRVDHPGELHRSISARRNGGSAREPIEIAFPGYDDRSALATVTDAEAQAYARAEFRASLAAGGRTGFKYHHSPGATFQGVRAALASDKGAADTAPDFPPAEFPAPARPIEGERQVAGNLYWCRPPEPHEARLAYAIEYDKNGMFPGAMAGRRYGVRGLHHVTSPAVFAKDIPGWHRVRYEAPSWPHGLPPPGWLLPPGAAGWLETETVAFLHEIGARIECEEAWLWGESARALDRLQARLRDARAHLMRRIADETLPAKRRAGAEIALDTFKTCIVEGIGWFNRVDDRDRTEILPRYRPHWEHAIKARAGANLSRDMMRAGERSGLCPIGVYVDALVYLSADPDAEALAARLGLALGTAFGQYKVKRILPARKFVETIKRARTEPTRLKALYALLHEAKP